MQVVESFSLRFLYHLDERPWLSCRHTQMPPSRGLWFWPWPCPPSSPHLGGALLSTFRTLTSLSFLPAWLQQGPGLHGNGDALPGTHPMRSRAPDGGTSLPRGKGLMPSPPASPPWVSPDPQASGGCRGRGRGAAAALEPSLILAASGSRGIWLMRWPGRPPPRGRGRGRAPSRPRHRGEPMPGRLRLVHVTGGGMGGGVHC